MMNALRWINNETKRLQKLHPHTSRKTLQKQAGKNYRNRHGASHTHKKKPAAKRKRRGAVGSVPFDFVPSISGTTRKKSLGKLGSVSAGTLKNELKKRLNIDIDRAVVQKYHAKKKSVKKKIQKRITQKKAELRKLV